jgi:hypothetical protein
LRRTCGEDTPRWPDRSCSTFAERRCGSCLATRASTTTRRFGRIVHYQMREELRSVLGESRGWCAKTGCSRRARKLRHTRRAVTLASVTRARNASGPPQKLSGRSHANRRIPSRSASRTNQVTISTLLDRTGPEVVSHLVHLTQNSKWTSLRRERPNTKQFRSSFAPGKVMIVWTILGDSGP